MLRSSYTLVALALCSAFLAGCPIAPSGSSSNVTDSAPSTAPATESATPVAGGVLSLRDVVSGRSFPSVPSANVRVEVINESNFAARVRLTMRVAGRQVHLSTRTLGAGKDLELTGPDRADSILLEATLGDGDGALGLPAQTRFLTTDFNEGDIVRFVLRSPIVSDCDENNIDDSAQADRDGDGRIDACDACPDDGNKVVAGLCGCGVSDADSDADGTPDCRDACPADRLKTAPGACGCGVTDADADRDGVLDCVDDCLGQNNAADGDADGTPDCDDGCPLDPTKTSPGACGCGVSDLDSNENGTPDCLDAAPLRITILQLDSDLRVGRGGRVNFKIRVLNVSSSARVRAYARRLGAPGSPEIPVSIGAALGSDFEASLLIEDLPPGIYEVFAEVQDGNQQASVIAIGRILVNSEPALTFDSPLPEQLVSTRVPFIVAWAGSDEDDDASIDIFLDRDQELNGNELILRSAVSEDNLLDRQVVVGGAVPPLPPGDYFVGGTIRDPLGEVVSYGQRICVRARLVGRVDVNLLGAELSVLRSQADNKELGFSLDMSRDADGDGRADLLVGDPSATMLDGRGFDDNEPIEVGRAYLFTSRDTRTRREFSPGQADVTYINRDPGAHLGERVAMISVAPNDRNGGTRGLESITRILLGAPRLTTSRAALTGRAYLVRAFEDFVFELCCQEFPELTYLDGGALDFVGADLAALGDVTGDGQADYAIGGVRLSNIGTVGIVSGGQGLPQPGLLTDHAFRVSGQSPLGFFGSVIRGVRDLDGDGLEELLVGEPFGGAPNFERSGRAYLLYGAERFSTPSGDSVEGEGLRVRRFVGEVVDDGAGFSLAVGDFDFDGRQDLLVGAPFHAGNRGRVYLLYDVGRAGLPEEIRLGDIGSPDLPGAIFDGVEAGEQFGFSVAAIGDWDADGYEDFAVGAPEAQAAKGVVRVIFGGPQRLTGTLSFQTFRCGFEAGELGDERSLDAHFGTALSAGDISDDGGIDLGIGAPTGARNGGGVYVIRGQTQDD